MSVVPSQNPTTALQTPATAAHSATQSPIPSPQNATHSPIGGSTPRNPPITQAPSTLTPPTHQQAQPQTVQAQIYLVQENGIRKLAEQNKLPESAALNQTQGKIFAIAKDLIIAKINPANGSSSLQTKDIKNLTYNYTQEYFTYTVGDEKKIITKKELEKEQNPTTQPQELNDRINEAKASLEKMGLKITQPTTSAFKTASKVILSTKGFFGTSQKKIESSTVRKNLVKNSTAKEKFSSFLAKLNEKISKEQDGTKKENLNSLKEQITKKDFNQTAVILALNAHTPKKDSQPISEFAKETETKIEDQIKALNNNSQTDALNNSEAKLYIAQTKDLLLTREQLIELREAHVDAINDPNNTKTGEIFPHFIPDESKERWIVQAILGNIDKDQFESLFECEYPDGIEDIINEVEQTDAEIVGAAEDETSSTVSNLSDLDPEEASQPVLTRRNPSQSAALLLPPATAIAGQTVEQSQPRQFPGIGNPAYVTSSTAQTLLPHAQTSSIQSDQETLKIDDPISSPKPSVSHKRTSISINRLRSLKRNMIRRRLADQKYFLTKVSASKNPSTPTQKVDTTMRNIAVATTTGALIPTLVPFLRREFPQIENFTSDQLNAFETWLRQNHPEFHQGITKYIDSTIVLQPTRSITYPMPRTTSSALTVSGGAQSLEPMSRAVEKATQNPLQIAKTFFSSIPRALKTDISNLIGHVMKIDLHTLPSEMQKSFLSRLQLLTRGIEFRQVSSQIQNYLTSKGITRNAAIPVAVGLTTLGFWYLQSRNKGQQITPSTADEASTPQNEVIPETSANVQKNTNQNTTRLTSNSPLRTGSLGTQKPGDLWINAGLNEQQITPSTTNRASTSSNDETPKTSTIEPKKRTRKTTRLTSNSPLSTGSLRTGRPGNPWTNAALTSSTEEELNTTPKDSQQNSFISYRPTFFGNPRR